MDQHYLKCGNIYFVPVLRNRLTFTVLVRQALQELTKEMPWNQEDLIAVGMPASIKKCLLDAIDLLPKVSLIIANIRGEQTREVFPVTPCDPMIEAVRLTNENNWPLEFIDLEIPPGNLFRSPCTKDPNWPDDMLIKALGIEQYLDMIEGYFSQPPARNEPIDSWREDNIVSKLRKKQPLFRRILVVCDAALIKPIIAKLQDLPHLTDFDLGYESHDIKYKIVQQLNLKVLLNYLDDYPKLVERYNARRWSDDIYKFNKYDELIKVVLESAERAKDLKFSTRQFKAFDTFLNNLIRFERRVCPKPDVLYESVASCLGIAFAERLHCYLTGYESQVAVERINRNSSASKALFSYEVKIDKSELVYNSIILPNFRATTLIEFESLN